MALVAVVIACLAGGTALIISGSSSHRPRAAPLPVKQFAIKPSTLGGLPPLRQGRVIVTGADPGWPGKPCRVPVIRSHLVIGSLCINAPILPVYQRPNGSLVIPYDVHEIGMWDGGAQLTSPDGKPLRQGATLLVGHVDYAGQGNGTLYDLYQVQPGAIVYASDASGHVTRWRVTSLTVVLKSELPSWVFAGQTGPRKLVIVTCGGPVDYVQGYGYSYRDNVIAVAVPA
jgi:hypothetical protein